MKRILPLLPTLLTLLTAASFAAEPPADWIAAGEKRRAEIPLGGDFKPNPKVPAFVAVGHGARIVMSRDDGKTWKQVFFGYPGADHGGWATNDVAYTNGVFAVPVGWTKPTSYLASEDGVNWRHLTDGRTQRFNILRSADSGKSWQEVFAFKPETEHVHGAQGLRDVAFGFLSAK